MESVDYIINSFASDVFLRVDARLYKKVKSIYNGDKTARQDEDLSELLYSGAVFEYNGDRWVDLHPLIRDYLDAHRGVLPD